MAPIRAQVFEHMDHALRQLIGLGKHNGHLGTQSPRPLTYRNAALEQKGADLVDYTGALANQRLREARARRVHPITGRLEKRT
jgi:hypothetical protein